MTLEGLDDLDRKILAALQRDARHASSQEIAETMDVSPSTVRKRIQRLERERIVTGYRATVDYGQAGYPLHMVFLCTVPIPDRKSLGEAALSVRGVVSVREIASGENNLFVTVVAEDDQDLTRIAGELSDLGIAIGEEDLILGEEHVPHDAFDQSADD